MKRSVRVCLTFGTAIITALALAACGSADDQSDAPTANDPLSTAHPECPDVCEAICNGEPEPSLPDGCLTPTCECDHPEQPACPDVCTALCNGEPEPPLPNGCPIPTCTCG